MRNVANPDDSTTGFDSYAEPSGFLERIGPLLQRRTEAGVVFAVRIAEHHCNRRGMAHGGVGVTLSQVALGPPGGALFRLLMPRPVGPVGGCRSRRSRCSRPVSRLTSTARPGLAIC